MSKLIDRVLLADSAALPRPVRRQCRHFSALLLIVLAIGLALTTGYIVATRDYFVELLPDHLISVVTLLLLFGVYLLNRSGRFRTAASMAVILMLLGIFASAVPTGSDAELAMLYYLPIPVVLSGLLLGVKFTILTAGLATIGVIAFPLMLDIPTTEIPLSSTLLISVFVVIAALQRSQAEADRHAELQESRARFEHLATHDPLTGLPNRLLFSELLKGALHRVRRTGGTLAVLFIDIDDFKAVNDGLGHDAGDTLIGLFGKRLATLLRQSDVVSRHGGDEFSVLLDGGEGDESYANVLSKLQLRMREPFSVDGREIFVTCSIGVSLYPNDAEESSELIRRADTALYKAKGRGKDSSVFYSARMSEEAALRLSLGGDLMHAVSNGEIEVVYQPQVDPITGRIVGAECLSRWNHPGRGLISPAVFIPLAEQSGSISGITDHVLATAGTTVSPVLGNRVIALNISERDLRDVQLQARVESFLERFQLRPGQLEIELTENIVFTNVDQARQRIARLKELGVRIAVDDFGAGFATLRQLAEFPIDVIKIDRSFVCEIVSSPGHQAIVAGIVEIARRLQMQVVAEGVESTDELSLVQELGCDFVQGWVYSKAVSGSRLLELLASEQLAPVGATL